MSGASSPSTTDRHQVVVAVLIIQLLVMVFAGGAWLWSQFWLYSAVGALSEDLVRRGGVDPAALGIDLERYGGSLGLWLMQGHDKNALAAGIAVIAAAVVGSTLALLCVCWPRRAQQGSAA